MATVIYTKPGCPYCAAAMEDMDGRGVVYTQKDVKSSSAIAQEALGWSDGQRKVPIVVDDGEVSIGFNGS